MGNNINYYYYLFDNLKILAILLVFNNNLQMQCEVE